VVVARSITWWLPRHHRITITFMANHRRPCITIRIIIMRLHRTIIIQRVHHLL
jgi:hypothetical protein